MKTLGAIVLGTLLGLSINSASAGGVSVLGGVDLDFNPSISLEYKVPTRSNIFLFSGLRYILESNKVDHSCAALSQDYYCESSEYKNKKDLDFYVGTGYDFGKVDISIYGGLGKSTQEYSYDKMDLKEGSIPAFRENINTTTKAIKTFAGLRIDIETNNKNIDLFVDGSVSKYSNSDSLNDKIIVGIKYDF